MDADGFPELSAAYQAWTAATSEASEDVRRLVRATLAAVEEGRSALEVGRRSENTGICDHPVARAFDRVLPLSALATGRNSAVLDPLEASVLLHHFGPPQESPVEPHPVEARMVAEWMESLRTDVPPPEPEHIPPPLSKDELRVDIDGNPDLAAALRQWTATTAAAPWNQQCFYWMELVRAATGDHGLTPKDGGPPMLVAFSDLAHELWKVGKAKRYDRPPFREQRSNETVGRAGAMIMLRHFGKHKDGPFDLPPIPEAGSSP